MLNRSKEKAELEKLKEELVVLNKERQRLTKELSALRLIISEINSTLDLDRVLDLIIHKGIQIVKAERGSVMLFDHKKEELYIKSSVRLSKKTVSAVRIKPGEGIAGWVFKEDKPLLIKEGAKDPRFKSFEAIKEELKSIISVPLKVRDQVIGVINVDNKRKGDFFNKDDLRLLSTFANQAAIAIQNAKLHQEIKQLAITDELTGLYNFRYIKDRLEEEVKRAQRFKHPLALIMADIDHFKEFNDAYGHLEGNKALQNIAGILQLNVREVDIVGRFGGEEFIIILPEANKKEAHKIAERIRIKVEDYNFINKKSHPNEKVTLSLGITSCFQENITPQGLVQKVDQALYLAKGKGRNRVEVI
ncbi:MAG: sensor domain-containing diguanylate cyclase [Candidatus Atribacteria bacterium]|nr:sensor domain-containing diguanylate cyclase [Candidatus Atribacteria bacterium]